MKRALWIITSLLLALALVAPAVASADIAPRPKAQPAQQATFVVRVIEASTADAPKVDPRLAEMQRELRPFEGRYNNFALLAEQTFTLGIGKSGQLALPGGGAFVLELMGFQPGKVQRVRYQVTTPGARQTRSVAPGGRTLDAIPNGKRLTIVSTTVR